MRSVGEYMREQKTRKELLLFNYNTRSILMEEKPSDMYQDMMKLNMLYEEMCWDNEDIIEFYPDYDSNTIIIRNKTMDEE